jgi:hypothetical protein
MNPMAASTVRQIHAVISGALTSHSSLIAAS